MDNKVIKILMIEDSPDDAVLIKRQLESSPATHFQVTPAKTLQDGLEHLAKERIDLIISDLGLPDSYGLDTVKRILKEAPLIPLVVLSGVDDESIAIKAVQAGAQDYLVKGRIDRTQMQRSLNYSIERARLLREVEEHNREIASIQTNLHKVLEKNADAIMVINKDKKILYCNQAAASLMGGARKELLNAEFKYALYPGAALEIEIELADKQNKTAELSVVEIDWEGRQASLVSMHDVTERKKMEISLKNSEEKFSRIFHRLPESITISNVKDGTFIDVNDTFCQAMGRSYEDTIGHTVQELGLWNKALDRDKLIKQIKEHGKIYNEEYPGVPLNGKPTTTLISADIIDINDEQCVVVIANNITERKQLEQAQKESEEKFSGAFHSSPSMIAICNMETGIFIEVNESFTRISGYTREEALGSNATRLDMWDSQEERARITSLLRNSEKISNNHIRMRSKSGEFKYGLFSSDRITLGEHKCYIMTITDITDLKKAEDLLRESEEKFSIAFQRSPEVILVSNLEDGAILEANDTFLRLTGYRRDELIGRQATELGLWADPNDRVQMVKTVKEKKVISNMEYKFRMKSGEVRTWLFSAEMIEWGGKLRILSVAVDITERKKMEDKLRFSDIALKSIHEGVFTMDNDLKITRWNEMCEQMLGIKASEAIGKMASDVIVIIEDYEGQNLKQIELLIKHGFARNEQKYRTPRGDMWVDVQTQAMEYNGERFGWLTMITDIDARKKAEEALKQSEEKYRELINTSNDAIVSVDSHMKFVVWNTGAEKLLGYTEKEILGQSVMAIFPAGVQKNVAKELVQIRKSGGSKFINVVIESMVMKRDCSLVPVDMSISARKAGNNHIITAIMRDITLRKEAEEKIRNIDQMKAEFLSNVSHELRTPLQSISGFTKLIMNGEVPDPETQQEFLQIIDRETLHLGNLINSLLDMSRLEAGRFQINRSPVELQKTIIETMKMFQSLAHQKNIELTEEISPDIPKMEVDNERMRQVIVNLVGNAIKFSDPGGSVKIVAEPRGNELFFQVIDHGTGIREENIKHLFERFYREEGETVRGGTGLGLYISNQIIEAHGGRIWAESKYGKGSTFSFTLPLNGNGGNNQGGYVYEQQNSDNRR